MEMEPEQSPETDVTALITECTRLGIDISGISNTEAASAEETYRLKLGALVLSKKLDNLELRRAEENAAKDKEIRQLRSGQKEIMEISRILNVTVRKMGDDVEEADLRGGRGAGAVVEAANPVNIQCSPEPAEENNINQLAIRQPSKPKPSHQTARKPSAPLHSRIYLGAGRFAVERAVGRTPQRSANGGRQPMSLMEGIQQANDFIRKRLGTRGGQRISGSPGGKAPLPIRFKHR